LNRDKIWKVWKKAKLDSEKMWKIWEKTKLNSEKIWKIQKKPKLNCEMIWKIWKKGKLKCEKIWKIQKKIVKRYEKYGKYGRFFFFFNKQLILPVIYLSLHYAPLTVGHIVMYPYCSIILAHTELYFIPSHKELCPLLQC
jgi:hypothetical protein